MQLKRTWGSTLYNLDLVPPTIYIKRVLRPACFVALSLAAFSIAAGQPSVSPSTSPASKPPASKPAASQPPTSKSTPAPATQTAPAKEQIAPLPTTIAPSTTAATPTPAPPNPAVTNNPPPSIPGLTPLPDKTVTLQFPNSDVVDVLRYYEQITGKKLIMDNFVQGKVNIALSRPVPRDEAIKIIEMNLLMNGYSLVPAGDDIVKVIGTGRSPRNAGIPLISDEADIPEGEHVVSFLFKLRFADPVELQQVLGQYLSPPQAYTSFLALPKAGSILITENSSVIRTLIRIVDQIDVPPAQVVSEFIKLERADATKVVEMLKEVFDKGGATTTTTTTVAPGVRPVRPPNVPQQPQQVTNQVQFEGDLSAFTALSEDSIVVGKIKIAADVRTNRIHVITRPVNMPFIKKLISEFDANVEFGKPVTRALRYISAAEVLPVIVQTLTEPGSNQAGGADTSNPAAAQQQANQNQRRTTNSNSSGFDSSSGSSGGGQSFGEELSTQAVDTTPKAVTIGNAKIIADQRSNSIIVLGNREVVVKVGKLLDEMDVKAPQVALSTVIGELTLKNDQTFGIDWLKAGGTPHTDINGNVLPRTQGDTNFAGVSRNAGGGAFDPANLLSLTNVAGAASSGTTVFLSSARDGLGAIVKALDSTGRFRVLNRPVVFTTNNKKAIIASGREIPVPVNTLSTINNTTVLPGATPFNNFGTQSSIQYKKVALQLEVVPLINSEKEVSLDILQKLDSLGTPTQVDGNLIPTVVTRYIKTTVSAPNCSTIVLGGLITDDKQVSKDGIPLLSRIPLIGALFRNTVRNHDRTELIVLMRPEVALTKLDLHRMRQKFEEKTHIGPELDTDDCPDCPKTEPIEDKQIVLPGPDMPGMK
jgi:type II secretion system protein D